MINQIDTSKIVIALDVLGCISSAMARRLGVLPVALDEDTVSLVMTDPEDDVAISQVEAHTHRVVRVLRPMNPAAFEATIRRYYPDGAAQQGRAGSALELFEQLVNRALQFRSSDIHIDPSAGGGCVRMRVDGMMRVDREMPAEQTHELTQAIKVAANLDIAEKRVPQDGQISLPVGDDDISMRVATVPTVNGEKITLRILATAAVAEDLDKLESLGMSDAHEQMMESALDCANGMILLSGPTGSGKTTTLYAALRRLREPGTRHIISIEDPVEIPLGGINQVHVDSERVSFNGALRSALRHDPDVIMIGEIRDEETADIAVKAAMTGHIVLSTLHTNDSVGIISRLLNLNVAREELAATVRLAVAQRLVRCPCPHCVKPAPPEERFRDLFGEALDATRTYPVAKGCSLCGGTGYAGRMGLYEMLPMDKSVRKLVAAKATNDEIVQAVFSSPGQSLLLQDGLCRSAEGKTTLSEVVRVAYMGGDA